MKQRIAGIISMSFMIFLIVGCVTVGPDYTPPETSVPEQWKTDLTPDVYTKLTDSETLASWWTTLNDPCLTDLIEQAIKGNLDLKEATARIREARARRGIAGADRFPTIDATGSARVSRSSEETGSGEWQDLYAVGFDASWELDLFGGIRRSIEAAHAEFEASQENFRDVLVSMLAEVGLNYVEACTFQTKLAVAEDNLEVQTETYELAAFRFEAGLTSEFDVEQAKYNLESTRSEIPALHSGLEKAKNRLAVLLGKFPGALDAELSEPKPIPVTPLKVAVGVPAEVLRRRPDIRRAERELAAQTARIGVARAELYPRFSLPGSIGLEAFSLGGLPPLSKRTYTIAIGPTVGWKVFDAGAIRQNIVVQDALQEQALIKYEASILTALEEVENALVAYVKEQSRRESLTEATHAAQRAVDLALDQYRSGLVDFQNVLESQRSLFSFQEQLADSDGSVTSNLIGLYKALGGGWNSMTVAAKASGEVK